METTCPTPRDAASLLVLRAGNTGGTSGGDKSGGVEILMGRRSAAHRFMPNILVFPGGAVDEADFLAPVGSRLRPEVRARLERSTTPSLAQALAVAAARELTEEVGLSIGMPPQLHRMDYLCRALTPPSRSIRFDARFFVVDAGHVSGTLAASMELEHPAWHPVGAALEDELVQPTRSILGQLRKWLAEGCRTPSALAPVPFLRDRIWSSE